MNLKTKIKIILVTFSIIFLTPYSYYFPQLYAFAYPILAYRVLVVVTLLFSIIILIVIPVEHAFSRLVSQA